MQGELKRQGHGKVDEHKRSQCQFLVQGKVKDVIREAKNPRHQEHQDQTHRQPTKDISPDAMRKSSRHKDKVDQGCDMYQHGSPDDIDHWQ